MIQWRKTKMQHVQESYKTHRLSNAVSSAASCLCGDGVKQEGASRIHLVAWSDSVGLGTRCHGLPDQARVVVDNREGHFSKVLYDLEWVIISGWS